MPRVNRHQLHFGPYRSPRFRCGEKVLCDARGEVTIRRLSDGRIPWPVGIRVKGPGLVLYKDLTRAVRREGACAVAYWWGICGSTVNRWRRTLDIGRVNEGDRRLRVAYASRPASKRLIAHIGRVSARDPEHNAKIAAAHRGKPRPKHVMEAVRKSHLGKRLSALVRRKISETKKRRGQRPDFNNPAWSAKEDILLLTLRPAQVAKRTQRTMEAVYSRRRKLGIANRRKRRRSKRRS